MGFVADDRQLTELFTAHPDPTLYPQLIRDFGKKLRRTYGWDEEDFYKAAAA